MVWPCYSPTPSPPTWHFPFHAPIALKGTHVRTFTICLNMKNWYYHLFFSQNLKFHILLMILKIAILYHTISNSCINEFNVSVGDSTWYAKHSTILIGAGKRLNASTFVLAWSLSRRLVVRVSCAFSLFHVDNLLVNCAIITCISKCCRLVQQRPCHVLLYRCENACILTYLF